LGISRLQCIKKPDVVSTSRKSNIDSRRYLRGANVDSNQRPKNVFSFKPAALTARCGSARYEITIDDPAAYTAPCSAVWEKQWTPDEELIKYFCQDNNIDQYHMEGNESLMQKQTVRLNRKPDQIVSIRPDAVFKETPHFRGVVFSGEMSEKAKGDFSGYRRCLGGFPSAFVH
jgi:hypothetical protein